MSDKGDRVYSDREVALVLKRASELEGRRDTEGAGGGLTLSQLEEIAREAGLDPDLVAEAALELDARRPERTRSLLGPPPVHRAAETVSGQPTEESLRELIQVVDHQVPEDGIVTQALGTVRWTGRGKLLSTQVSVGPSGDRTRIQVTRRFREQIRPMLHVIPGVWGLVGGMAVAAGLGLSGGVVAAVAAGGTLLGAGIGRTIWHVLSAGSDREVKRLVRELSQRARTES
jgi:hypothetical protein